MPLAQEHSNVTSVRAAPSIRQQLQRYVKSARTASTEPLYPKGEVHVWAVRLANFAMLTSLVQKVVALNALLAIILPMLWHSTAVSVLRVAHSHYLDSTPVTHADLVGWHAHPLSSAANVFEVDSLMVTQGGANAALLAVSPAKLGQSRVSLALRDGTATIARLHAVYALQADIVLRPRATKVAAPALPVDSLPKMVPQHRVRHVQLVGCRLKVLCRVLCAVKAWRGHRRV